MLYSQTERFAANGIQVGESHQVIEGDIFSIRFAGIHEFGAELLLYCRVFGEEMQHARHRVRGRIHTCHYKCATLR